MRIGSKVICINDSIDPEKYDEISKDLPNWITKGETYTIRDILDNDGIVTGVLLEEIKNKKLFMKLINRVQEPAFAIWRFEEIKTIENKVAVKAKKFKFANA